MLPPSEVREIGGMKLITTYTRRDDGKVEKRTKHFKLEKQSVQMTEQALGRRQWKKFGVAAGNAPGPDTASTNVVTDDVYLQLQSARKVLLRTPLSPSPRPCSLEPHSCKTTLTQRRIPWQ